jgi:hypothetical protein
MDFDTFFLQKYIVNELMRRYTRVSGFLSFPIKRETSPHFLLPFLVLKAFNTSFLSVGSKSFTHTCKYSRLPQVLQVSPTKVACWAIHLNCTGNDMIFGSE